MGNGGGGVGGPWVARAVLAVAGSWLAEWLAIALARWRGSGLLGVRLLAVALPG